MSHAAARVAFVVGVAACSASSAPRVAEVEQRHGEDGARATAVAWSADRATAYLSRRATKWLDERRCALSCHTTHPFVLADTGSPERTRIVNEVTARLAAWPDVTPWYATDDDKIAESRGTESVLNAFALAGTPDATAALDAMYREQRADGGWSWLDFDLAPWEEHHAELTGAVLAAIATTRTDGYRADKTRVAALRGFIAANKRAGLYLHDELALLWASRTVDDLVTANEVRRYAADLRKVQRPDGGFSLADLGPWRRTDGSANVADASDGYATAFAALGLAVVTDAETSATVAAARCWLASHQRDDGSWPGRSLNDDDAFNRSLMTDAATAYAVIALREAGALRCPD